MSLLWQKSAGVCVLFWQESFTVDWMEVLLSHSSSRCYLVLADVAVLLPVLCCSAVSHERLLFPTKTAVVLHAVYPPCTLKQTKESLVPGHWITCRRIWLQTLSHCRVLFPFKHWLVVSWRRSPQTSCCWSEGDSVVEMKQPAVSCVCGQHTLIVSCPLTVTVVCAAVRRHNGVAVL